MGIFSNSSPFDEVVGKATLETNTKEDWSLILDICDRVTTTPTGAKECLRSIVSRLNHPDPHVVVQAITLLDACVSNCGLPFHLEIASRDFEQEYCKLLTKIQEKTVRDKLLQCLQKWAESFKSDPQLDLIPSLVGKLKAKGVHFSDSPHKSTRKSSHHHHHSSSKNRDMSSSSAVPAAQEDADLAKAIELSLKEAQTHSQNKTLYPQASSLASGSAEEKEPKKVRALYDFEAAEENELTFYAGEIVFVTDDSDTNWWQGSNQRGKGLFPANFVTYDLSAEPTKFEVNSKKTVQFSEDVEVQSIETEPEIVEIDEGKIDKVLHVLHEADPTGEVEDPADLCGLEEQVNQMAPLIDQELEKIDRRHAQLTRLGGELVEALNMYHNLMREPVASTMPYGGPVQYPGYPPYDPNVPYSMMRPPHSAPPAANGAGYNSMPYQSQPQSNGMGQQHMNQQQQMGNLGGVPNGQIGGQPQMPNSPQVSQPVSMAGGQIPYSQPMMMPQGQNMNMQGGYESNPMSQPQNMGMPPHMMSPQNGPYGQGLPQGGYPQSSTAPSGPAV
ncbi:signal transducing adapter molecule 2 isoform X2 [Folsomia candida]|uniref:signal transducing adapter molecule 2 isoform X2 n=1 Tax=Folsomia candida TaxID=158441 RepID=UPI000B8FFBCB|nr:signal transducing adapter molecule 2 isoform X2 [Folsomia candida]